MLYFIIRTKYRMEIISGPNFDAVKNNDNINIIFNNILRFLKQHIC